MHHRTNCRGWVGAVEHRRARNQDIRPGPNHVSYILRTYSTIHFDPELAIAPVSNLTQIANLFSGFWNKCLPPKTRIHRHHQHMVELAKYIGEHDDRSGRIDYRPSAAAVFPDHRKRPVQMRRRLLMNRNHVGARLGESSDVALRILDH